MKPWLVLLIASASLNGFVLLALFFSGQSAFLNSVLAAAVLPTLMSSLLLFLAGRTHDPTPQQLQKINIAGFFFKVLLIGTWTAILIKSGNLDKMTFIVILLINFLAWHGVEAYYWPLFTAGDGRNKGENS